MSIVYALFGLRPFDFDEAGVFNAPYMVAAHWDVSYPVFSYADPDYFEHIWFHPPVHYILLGLVMKIMPLFYAEGVLPIIFVALSLWFVVSIRADSSFRFAYALSLFSLIVIAVSAHMSNFGVRPEMNMTLCWAAGLIALEKGRHDNWAPWPLAIGAFLVTLGATFHYIGMAFVFGLPFYAYAAYRDQEISDFKKSLTALAAGSFLIGIPFLVFFFAPMLEKILVWREITSQSIHSSNPIEIFLFHIQRNQSQGLYWGTLPWFQDFTGALQRMYMPTGLVSAVGLLFFRQTRLIALAVLPEMIFVYFYAGKSQPFYLLLQFFLFYIFSYTLLFRFLSFLLKRKGFLHLEKVTLFVISFAVTLTLTVTSPNFQFAFDESGRRHFHWMDLARAASQTIVGPDAVMFGREPAAYISGAKFWYPMKAGPLPTTPSKSGKEDLRQITGAIEYNLMNVNDLIGKRYKIGRKLNQGQYAGYYALGEANLRGWVVTPGAGFAFFSAERPEQIRFYRILNTKVLKFETLPTGDSVAGTYVCIEPNDRHLRQYAYYLNHLERFPTYLEINGTNPQVLGIFITSNEQFSRLEADLPKGCRIRESFRGNKVVISHAEFMLQVPEFHKNEFFFRNMADAVAEKKRRSPK